jgi:hypothetical protein
MPGLVPGIHVLASLKRNDVDGRDEPGHDEEMRRHPDPGRCDFDSAFGVGLILGVGRSQALGIGSFPAHLSEQKYVLGMTRQAAYR